MRDAKPGYEWVVQMVIYTHEPALSCAEFLISWDPDFGGNPRRHMQRAGKHSVPLLGERLARIPNAEYLCRGPARVALHEHKIGSEKSGIPLRGAELEFRIAAAP